MTTMTALFLCAEVGAAEAALDPPGSRRKIHLSPTVSSSSVALLIISPRAAARSSGCASCASCIRRTAPPSKDWQIAVNVVVDRSTYACDSRYSLKKVSSWACEERVYTQTP
jgi:hypothetical protein